MWDTASASLLYRVLKSRHQGQRLLEQERPPRVLAGTSSNVVFSREHNLKQEWAEHSETCRVAEGQWSGGRLKSLKIAQNVKSVVSAGD